MLKETATGTVNLLHGLFSERATLNKKYLLSLNPIALLQNFYTEAGIVLPELQVLDDPDSSYLHWGWEAPTCQLRGHFLGHWMSAAALLSTVQKKDDFDYETSELKERLIFIVKELKRCQKLNGGKWAGSIPEKYFDKLEKNEYVWSPQYTMHKTIMGLTDAYRYAGITEALEVLEGLKQWYLIWTLDMQKKNPHAVYSGEEGGMLEAWALLYELTQDNDYLILAERYSNQSLFRKLLNGLDPLTNTHMNASIPHAQGACKMYEVTKDEAWLDIAKAFWKCAVTDRDAYATGGQGAGEYWVPPHLNNEYRGDRNQEFCTAYNMVRLASYLLKFTGSSEYGDYIEKNLYNAFLTQQNKNTGLPTYFLPMSQACKKKWGSKTRDFWCCYGTMVQAHTLYTKLTYYPSEDGKELIISQYIPSEYEENDFKISQTPDMKYYNDKAFFDENDTSEMSRWLLKFNVTGGKKTLKFRIPEWVNSKPVVSINGKDFKNFGAEYKTENNYLVITKDWTDDIISIYFNASLRLSPLPDNPNYAALLEGPIVLAAINTDYDSDLSLNLGRVKHVTEHTYLTYPWLQSNYRLMSAKGEISLIPLYDITDETYTMYMPIK